MNDGGWNNPAATPSHSSGSLKAKITLKGGAAYGFVSPFYSLKPELPQKSPMLGSMDLLNAYDLGSVYSRFCGSKKIREDLASFLPSIYGNFNINPTAQDISSLRRLIEKPPITGKEIAPLSTTSMNGFKLNPGPVDERYRYLFERKRESDYPPYDMGEKSIGKFKSSLEALDPTERGEDGERKRHKSEKKEKKKKKDKKKKDKKDDERKHKKASAEPGSVPSAMEF